MLTLSFTPSDIDALHYERYHHPHPRVQRKMEALYLKSQGMPHGQIARLVRISEPTLVSYFRTFEADGLEGLKALNFYRPQSDLKRHQSTLEAQFRAHPPKTLAQAAATIKEITGITRSREQVRIFLKSMGMTCSRVGLMPAKADPDKQEAFQKKINAPS